MKQLQYTLQLLPTNTLTVKSNSLPKESSGNVSVNTSTIVAPPTVINHRGEIYSGKNNDSSTNIPIEPVQSSTSEGLTMEELTKESIVPIPINDNTEEDFPVSTIRPALSTGLDKNLTIRVNIPTVPGSVRSTPVPPSTTTNNNNMFNTRRPSSSNTVQGTATPISTNSTPGGVPTVIRQAPIPRASSPPRRKQTTSSSSAFEE